MTICTAKLTDKFQITIPVAVRRRLRLKEGDVVCLAIEGEDVVLRAVGGSWTEATRGCGAHVWQRAGGKKAIERERRSWGRR